MFINKLQSILNTEYPIIQAPMAGGVTTSELVAEASNAGCLGMIGAGYLTPLQIREQIQVIKGKTNKPFGINLFVLNEIQVTNQQIQSAREKLQPISDQLEVDQEDWERPKTYEERLSFFKEQIQVVIEEKLSVCSFTFGIPSDELVTKFKQQSITLIGTATTVQEAIEIEKKGFDLIVVQGSEAGGHRGDFLTQTEHSLIGLMSLIPQTVDQVGIPVVAAGGIMDGRGLMAALCLGAKGVQMGTAFLTCKESGANQLHKKAIFQAKDEDTVLTRAFSGKWARGIENQFIRSMKEVEDSFPEFPVQNSLTKPIRKQAAAKEVQDYMSLWSGQSPGLARDQTVAELVKKMITEAEQHPFL